MAPQLVFRLLVVAEGHIPTITKKTVDPQAGRATISLKPHDLDSRADERIVKGRVVDEEGNAVPRAVIEPFGMKTGSSTRYGSLPDVDALVVSNEKGEFRIGVGKKGVALFVKVDARDLAPQNFGPLATDGAIHTLTLHAGVNVVGSVRKNGKPLPGVAVGLAQEDRGVGTYVGDFKISTNELGEFLFLNVPANDRYTIYGLMQSCRPHGAIAVQRLDVGASGTTSSAGALDLVPGHRLAGRVILVDGKDLPAGTHILVSRKNAWDFQTQQVNPNGSFQFDGLPEEQITLSARVRGYHISVRNSSFTPLNPFGLIGVVRQDIDELRLLLAPGPMKLDAYRRLSRTQREEYQQRRNEPLEGAPAESKE